MPAATAISAPIQIHVRLDRCGAALGGLLAFRRANESDGRGGGGTPSCVSTIGAPGARSPEVNAPCGIAPGCGDDAPGGYGDAACCGYGGEPGDGPGCGYADPVCGSDGGRAGCG